MFFWAAKYHPFLDAPLVFDDDARQHIYWTYGFLDGELFRDDVLTAFMSSPRVAPAGYRGLYWLGAQALDPLLFGQLLSLVLMTMSVLLLARIGAVLGNAASGMFPAFLFLPYFLYSSSGGVSKSFAFPALILAVHLAMEKRFAALAAVLLGASLFYPPILPNCAALAGATWLRACRKLPGRKAVVGLLALMAGGVLALGVLVTAYQTGGGSAFGPLMTREAAFTMPEFHASGRIAFFGETWAGTLLNDAAGIGAVRFIGFVAILGIICLIRRPMRFALPIIVVDLLWTSTVLFVAAHVFLFRLYLPSRYTLYSLPLAALLLVAANGPGVGAALERRWPSLASFCRRVRGNKPVAGAILVLGAAGFTYMQNRYIVAADPLSVSVDATALAVYQQIEALPKNVLIAGHPLEMDNVPLLARRRVLANHETALPFYVGYYQTVERRLLDSLRAYYAQDVQAVRNLAEQHGVDYILLDQRHFAPSFLDGPLYFEPFGSQIKRGIDRSKTFVLLEGGVGRRVYENGPYILISLADLKRKDGP